MRTVAMVNTKSYRNIVYDKHFSEVFKHLAEINAYVTSSGQIKKRLFKKRIITLSRTIYKTKMSSCKKISLSDIDRLENPKKGEIPVNAFDILLILLSEILIRRDTFEYRAKRSEDKRVSLYLLSVVIEIINQLILQIETDILMGENNMRTMIRARNYPVCRMFKDALKEFDEMYPKRFNEVFV